MPRPTKAESARRKADYLRLLARGETQSSILRNWRVSYSILDYWRKHDVEFRREEDRIKGALGQPRNLEVPDFMTFRKRYIGYDTPRHQLVWLEALDEGRRVMILQPPRHGKSTFMEDYILWRICSDQTIRTLFISQNEREAVKRLERVAQYLGDPALAYRDNVESMIADFGPFKGDRRNKAWSSQMIYAVGASPKERDPTVEAKGVGTQIYGGGFDLIVLDDAVALKNQETVLSREKFMRYFKGEVMTRLPKGRGHVAIIGTRVDPEDSYGEIMENPAWDVLIQPAIDGEGKALWPEEWPVERLMQAKDDDVDSDRLWALLYQQQVTDLPDARFNRQDILNCVDASYTLGDKRSGLIVTVGVDPGRQGVTAAVAVGLDTKSKIRYLLDVSTQVDTKDTGQLFAFIADFCARNGARECKVEENFGKGYLSDNPELRMALASFRCQLTQETTTTQKYDSQIGITSVASLIREGMYRFPGGGDSMARLDRFINELCAWQPQPQRRWREKQDQVIAFWLAELAVRRYEHVIPIDKMPRMKTFGEYGRRSYRWPAKA
jgi:hypothetical protein